MDEVTSGRDYHIIKSLQFHRIVAPSMRALGEEAFIVKTDDCDRDDSLAIRANLRRAGLLDAEHRPTELFRGFHDMEVEEKLKNWSLLPEKHRGNKPLLRDVGLLLWGHVPFEASIELSVEGVLEIYADTRAMEYLRDEWDRDWPGGDGKLRYFNDGPQTQRRPFTLTRHGPKSNRVIDYLYMLTEGPMGEDPAADFEAWVRAPRRKRGDGKLDVLT